jgi:hypothetical protein
VLGHDHISGDEESIPWPDALQRLLEYCARLWVGQQRVAMMTTEGDEVQAPGLLEIMKSPGHEPIVVGVNRAGCDPTTRA